MPDKSEQWQNISDLIPSFKQLLIKTHYTQQRKKQIKQLNNSIVYQ